MLTTMTPEMEALKARFAPRPERVAAELTRVCRPGGRLGYPFPPAEVVEFFRAYYGPTNRAFAALDAAGQSALHEDLEQLWAGNNRESDGSTYVEAEYLEVVAIRGERRRSPPRRSRFLL
jgi:hypothetical protein